MRNKPPAYLWSLVAFALSALCLAGAYALAR